MKCEASAACDEERIECRLLDERGGWGHICLCVTCQIGACFDVVEQHRSACGSALSGLRF